MKAFLSSTYIDLADHRKIVSDALERMSLSVGRMEILGAKPQEPKDACLSLIDECDLFIGVYAHRYGFIPGDQGISITEMEYEYAKSRGKSLFCFLIDEDEPWAPKFIDDEPAKSKLKAFKQRVKDNLTVDFFSKPADLAYKVSTSIADFLSKQAIHLKHSGSTTVCVPPPSYFHGSYAKTANGDSICLGWVQPKLCDAIKLYQGFSPSINPLDRSSFDRVDYFNGIGLASGVQYKGRKYYYRVSAVYENIESGISEEICIDTSRIPIDNYRSLSPKLSPTNLAAVYTNNEIKIQWDNPSEVELMYVVYICKNDEIKKHISYEVGYVLPVDDSFEKGIYKIFVSPLLLGNEGYSTNPIEVIIN